jgi:membrane peptidoglycan carboxypeptidase
MLRFLRYFILFCLTLGLLVLAAVGSGLYYLVVVEPGSEIEQANIESILGRESPVLYSDGQKKLGVLFQDFHRQYLSYDQIPPRFVQALVAAEDNRFFHHYGLDIPGIIRAMIANFKAGRVVQGGSTLTQQTAKNLFKRESRSYRAKLKELLYALRLEHWYSKEKILEFYSNQFYVSGNGHGLGVAARYYFDKAPAELNLLECAFIAGSVKRPNYYNPFTKKNKNQVSLARKRADERAGYVLRNMLKEGTITEKNYQDAIESDIVFNQGKTAYALNTIMDLVKDGLGSDLITDVLEEHGISNVSTSGVRIITSIDYDLQASTLYALRKHLSLLQVRLHGYKRDEVQQAYKAKDLAEKKELRARDFVFGTIHSIETTQKGEVSIKVSFGDSLPLGIIDGQGIEQILTALVKHEKNRWSTVNTKKDLPLLLAQLHEGDLIYVSVRSLDLSGGAQLDLACYPQLEGAALIMQKGAILSMAGGIENRFFNRAIDAKRLMGSTFKPFLFAAALQLGWNAVDMLDNRRNVFIFMDRPYFPRPDHHSPFDSVSMSWAGVKSENVAAVWLLYHLTDYLTPSRLRELAGYLDMAPRSDKNFTESYRQFKVRIRDHFGIKVNQAALEQAAYDLAVQSLEADFLFEDRAHAYELLRNLPYGFHFDRYRKSLKEQLAGKNLKERMKKELRLRIKLLSRSYLGLHPLLPVARDYQKYFVSLLEEERAFFSSFTPRPAPRPDGLLVEDEQGHLIVTVEKELPETWLPISDAAILDKIRNLDTEEMARFWNSVQLEGAVCVCTYDQVQSQMERERIKLLTAEPYSMELLAHIRDYRIMVGLQYLVRFGKACGIESVLKPVLSFPLGSNVVSLIESVRMYEALVTGLRYDVDQAGRSFDQEETQRDGLAIIERIETREGRILYSRKPTAVRVIDEKSTAAVTNILQNVVRYGTGRYASQHIRLQSNDPERQQELESLDLSVPLMGKTGTANRYRNASFFGYVPVPAAGKETAMVLENGYTVGAYVGYDKNKTMISGTTRITGSSGGLPVWCDMVAALLEKEQAGERLDLVDLSFNGLGLRYPETGQLFVPVDPDQGGVVLPGRGGRHALVAPDVPVILSYGPVGKGGRFEPARMFQPFWKNYLETAAE